MQKPVFLSPYTRPFTRERFLYITDLFGRKFTLIEANMTKKDRIFYESVEANINTVLFGFVMFDPIFSQLLGALTTQSIQIIGNRNSLSAFISSGLYICYCKDEMSDEQKKDFYNKLLENYRTVLQIEEKNFLYSPYYGEMNDNVIGY